MRASLIVAPALLLGLAAVVVWIWTLIDVLRTSDDSRFRAGTQLVWVIVIVFTQIIGSLIYLAIGRPRRQQSEPPGH